VRAISTVLLFPCAWIDHVVTAWRFSSILEHEILDQGVDDVQYGSRVEASAVPEHIPNVPVADLAHEWRVWPSDAVAVEDGGPQLLQIAVLPDERLSGLGGQDDDCEVPGFRFEEGVGLVVAALVEVDPDSADELVADRDELCPEHGISLRQTDYPHSFGVPP